MKRIFISSVQREFSEVRILLKRYITRNPAYRRLFSTFVFEEDVVSMDRRTDEVYIDELRQCDIYLGLIGSEYGFEDCEGISPTEREFDEATRLGLPRLMFVLGNDSTQRHPNNPKIADQLYQTKHIEKFGTGFTDLIADCRAVGLQDPEVDDASMEFTITIWRCANKVQINADKNANKKTAQVVNDEEIIAFIVKNQTLSVKNIANKMQIKLGVMRSTINRLKREKGLRHIGSRKSGHWVFDKS